MAIFLHFLLCLGVVLAQVTLSAFLSIKGVYPDLCLVLACMAGLVAGEYRGLAIGLTVGFFQDLLTPSGVGLNIILKGLAGILAGVTTHTISALTGPVVLLVTLALSWGCGFASLITTYPIVNFWDFVNLFSSFLLPQGLYHGLLGAAIFWVIQTFRLFPTMVKSGLRSP